MRSKWLVLVIVLAFSMTAASVYAEEAPRAMDSSGNNHHSYVLKGTFVPDGRIGGALRFNGVDDRVELNDGTLNDMFLHNEFSQKTIALWFKADRTTGKQMLYEQGGSVNGLALRIIDGQLEVGVAGRIDEAIVREQFQTPFTDTGWNHAVLVYDAGSIKLHLNGAAVIDAASTVKKVGQAANSGGFGDNIGSNNAFNENQEAMPFQGLIEDLRIYAAAVAPDGTTMPDTGLEAWYKLDEGAAAEGSGAGQQVPAAVGETAANPQTSDSGVAAYWIWAAMAVLSLAAMRLTRKQLVKQS